MNNIQNENTITLNIPACIKHETNCDCATIVIPNKKYGIYTGKSYHKLRVSTLKGMINKIIYWFDLYDVFSINDMI